MPLSNSVNDKEAGGNFSINGPFELHSVGTVIHDFGGAKSKGPAPQLRIVGFKSADQPSNDPTVIFLSCSELAKIRPGLFDPATGQGRYIEPGEVGNCFETAPGVTPFKGLPENTKAAKFLFSVESLIGRGVGLYNEMNGVFMTLKSVKEKSEFTEKDGDFGIDKKEAKDIEYTYATAVHPQPLWQPHTNVTIPEGKGKAKKKDAAAQATAPAFGGVMAAPGIGAPAGLGVPSFAAPMAAPTAPALASPFGAPMAPAAPAPSMMGAPMGIPQAQPMAASTMMAPPAMIAPAPPAMSVPSPMAAAPAAPPPNPAWVPWGDEIVKRVLTKYKQGGTVQVSWADIQTQVFGEVQAAVQADPGLMAAGGLREIMGVYVNPAYRVNPNHTQGSAPWVEQGGICALVG